MTDFKDQVLIDLKIFFNEFAEPHTYNGKSVSVVIDNDHLKERSKKEYDGISVGDILFFILSSDLENIPEPEQQVKFDNSLYKVFDVRQDNGMCEVILQRNAR